MEVIRYKYVFFVLGLMMSHVNNEVPSKDASHNSSCPYSKIIEDIFKVNKNSTQINSSERAKLFLHSIANITTNNVNVTEEKLVNDIIAAINRIKNNMTKEKNDKLNEAIILFPHNETFNKVTNIKSGIEEKIDVTESKKPINKIVAKTTTEKTNYVEILTIEPNNTQKSNATSHNIMDVLKHLMPMFNTTIKKDLHNITIIESNILRNHSFTASKNVSTIIVTYCDKHNETNNITTTTNHRKDGEHDDYDYYGETTEDEEDSVSDGDKKDILEAANYGMQKMHELYSVLEPKLYSMGLWLDETNPARYVAAFNAPSEDATLYTRYGYASLQATTKLKELIK